ncbi:uncharacterized protein PHACADRAFT_253776 [Phanerochaete carnosa HHB-10118-sp]|uniref:Uncharacterized protein n=1 Tax=Phanerochaete carnosa (strain HHB-10118-sp) TaxID=650164 RepID=K5VYA9_PHACS|nr:uncharacterized protein PHACADRAFT_253776 [Phanerochaete carnosa HHB-10118-sp]EKM56568.1 hypothetical protein PHACADRAFT_253776 [Phanerochaete carnosa HHB-10118-sp]
MFFLRRPPSAPDEIYSSSLATLHQGHALWCPEPNESGEPQIGDVGFKVTFWDPPFEITEPLPPGALKIYRRHRPLVPDHYRSHGVEVKQRGGSAGLAAGGTVSATLGADYTCKASQGAVLELKSEAYAEAIFENLELKQYILRHHGEWHKYAKGKLHQDVKRGDIVMICGWVKTEADWAATAFSNTSTNTSISVGVQAGAVAGANAGASNTSSTTGPTMRRQGENYAKASGPAVKPSDTPTNASEVVANVPGLILPEPTRDQSVFVRRYKVETRLGVLKEVVAGAGYHRLPDAGDGRGDSAAEGIVGREGGTEDIDETSIMELGNEGEVPDPLDVLLRYILETTDVETAIASDDDVWSIVGGKSVIDFASYLRQMQPPVQVDGMTGSLCMEDVISHDRSLAFTRRTITKSVLAEWPDAALDGAGGLEDGLVFTGPSKAEIRPLKLKRATFSDPQNPSGGCKHTAVSADGTLLAASFESTDVLVWRLSDGLLVQRLHHQGHPGYVQALSFSPVDYTLVSGSKDNTAIVWDTRHGRVLLRLEGYGSGPVRSIAYAPHGTFIATGSEGDNSSVKIWDASSGACLHSFSVDEYVYNLTFSPDSLCLCAELKTACNVYDIYSYTHTATLQHVAGEMLFLSMSHQGDRVVTVPADPGQVKIWSATAGEELLTIDHSNKLSKPVAFSSDGAEVVAACEADAAAIAYDSRTGQVRHIFKLTKPAYQATYSPDGEYVAFGAKDGDLELYDAKSGTFLAKFDGREGSGTLWVMPFLPDSQTILARSKYGPLSLYNIQDVLRMR